MRNRVCRMHALRCATFCRAPLRYTTPRCARRYATLRCHALGYATLCCAAPRFCALTAIRYAMLTSLRCAALGALRCAALRCPAPRATPRATRCAALRATRCNDRQFAPAIAEQTIDMKPKAHNSTRSLRARSVEHQKKTHSLLFQRKRRTHYSTRNQASLP